MVRYKLSKIEDGVTRINDDGTQVFMFTTNPEYQEWLADGNTPDPVYTQAELDAIAAEEARQQEIADEFLNNVLNNKTFAQIENWIETEVATITDIPTLQAYLLNADKKMARVILALTKKLGVST